MGRMDDSAEGNAVTLKFTPATAATLARTITPGTEIPADATAFHLTGYGVHFAAGAVNTGEMKVTQANTSTDAQPGSVYMGPGGGSWRQVWLGEYGVRLALSDGAITLTYTHGASVALGAWATGFWVR